MTLLNIGLHFFFAGLIFWLGSFSRDDDFPAWASELLNLAFVFAVLAGAVLSLVGLGVYLAPCLS